MNIVIVDDEHIIRQGLRRLIERSRTDARVVGEAGDGAEALVILRSLSCDLLIADIQMPVMDGMELIAEVRRSGMAMEIVILSGYGEFAYAQDAIRHGVTDYILKPMRPAFVEEMLEKIHRKMTQRESGFIALNRCFQQCSILVAETAEAIWQLDARGIESGLDRIRVALDDLGLEVDRRASVHAAFLSWIVSRLESRSPSGGRLQEAARVREEDAVADSHLRFSEAAGRLADEIRANRNWGQRGPVREAIDYIRNHFSDSDLSLAVLLQRTGLSATYFYELFRAETGQNFKSYVIRLRIEHAKALLDSTGLKGYEVGEKVGYPDYPHFTKLFKKTVGVSPTEYKRNMERGWPADGHSPSETVQRVG